MGFGSSFSGCSSRSHTSLSSNFNFPSATQFYSGLYGNRHGRAPKCGLWPPPGIRGGLQQEVVQRLHCSSQAWDTDYLNSNLPDKGPLSGWFWVTVVRNLLCFHSSCKERSTAAPFWCFWRNLPLLNTFLWSSHAFFRHAWILHDILGSWLSHRSLLRLFTFTFDPETTGLTGGDVIGRNLIVRVWKAWITGHYFCVHDVVMNVIK